VPDLSYHVLSFNSIDQLYNNKPLEYDITVSQD